MENWKRLILALQIIGIESPNVFYIGADVKTDYLLFYEGYVTKEQKIRLENIGAVFVGKYEAWAFEREFLWDNRSK